MERTYSPCMQRGQSFFGVKTLSKTPFPQKSAKPQNVIKMCVTTEDSGKKLEKTTSARWLHKVPKASEVRCLKHICGFGITFPLCAFHFLLKIMPKSYLKQPFVVTWTSYTKCCTVPFAEKHIKYILTRFFSFLIKPRRTSEPFATFVWNLNCWRGIKISWNDLVKKSNASHNLKTAQTSYRLGDALLLSPSGWGMSTKWSDQEAKEPNPNRSLNDSKKIK